MSSNKYIGYGDLTLDAISKGIKGNKVPVELLTEVAKASALLAIAKEMNRSNSARTN